MLAVWLIMVMLRGPGVLLRGHHLAVSVLKVVMCRALLSFPVAVFTLSMGVVAVFLLRATVTTLVVRCTP